MAASGGSRTKERARERIERLAGQGLDLPTLWREATVALAPAVPHYHAPCWFTLDPATLLVTSHYDPGIPELPAEWLAHQYFEDDVHKLADVARSERGISTLHEATEGDPGRSPGWNAFVRPFGGEQELLLALRTRTGEVWGMLGLYREPGRPRFDSDEMHFLQSVAPALAAGARRGLLVGEAAEPEGPEAPGLVALGEDWRVESLTPGVERWLAALPGAGRGAPSALPPAVLAVAAFGLTEREQDVTRMVLQGESTTEIAAGLRVCACPRTPCSSTSSGCSRRRACAAGGSSPGRSSSPTTSRASGTTSAGPSTAGPSGAGPPPGQREAWGA